MTREEIQAELDALKGTKFDKVSDSLLQLYDRGLPCRFCGEAYNVGTLKKHEKACEKDLELLPIFLIIYNDGRMVSNVVLAKELKVTARTITRLHKKAKTQPWSGGVSGAGKKTNDLWEKIKPLLDQGLTQQSVADMLDLTYRNVSYLVKHFKYKIKISNIEKGKILREEFLKLYHQGLTDKEIAGKMNKDKVQINNWRKRYNLPPNKKT